MKASNPVLQEEFKKRVLLYLEGHVSTPYEKAYKALITLELPGTSLEEAFIDLVKEKKIDFIPVTTYHFEKV